MNIGTIVTWDTKNPNSKTSRIGVVVLLEADIPGNVLVAEGALTVEQAKNDDYQIASISPDLLTEVSPVVVQALLKR